MKSQTSYIKRFYSLWLIVPALFLYIVFFIMPNLGSFFISLTDWSRYNFNEFKYIGLDNFKRLFSEKLLAIAFFNTIYYTIFTIVMKNVLGLLLALLTNCKLKSEKFLRSLFFLPSMLSITAVAAIFKALYNNNHGLINNTLRAIGLGGLATDWLFETKTALTAICIMDVWQSVGFSMVIFLAALQVVPKDILEAGKIDGTGPVKQFFYITFPMIMNAMIVNFTLVLIGSMKVFTQVYALTGGGPIDSTHVMSTYFYKTFSDGHLAYSTAVGLVQTVFIVIVTFGALFFLRKKEIDL